ncbi:MAG: carboxymuconolactone decarboxylase family protein [Burkholderiales bacterium]|nr:carboxymuconolactone decarboxylase family protein [Burkholderiales bacterium]
MSYIDTPANFPYPYYLRWLFRRQRRRYGRELEPVRLWARIAPAFLAMSAMYRALDRKSSPIEPALRSLIQIRVSQINVCEFCVDMNAFLGRERGVDEDKALALARFEDSELFSAREKAALAYAEAVTRSDRGVDAALMARLRTHFDDQTIVELAALIAYQNMSSKFNAALGVPAHGFCATGREDSPKAGPRAIPARRSTD